jgi:hypothetical protein
MIKNLPERAVISYIAAGEGVFLYNFPAQAMSLRRRIFTFFNLTIRPGILPTSAICHKFYKKFDKIALFGKLDSFTATR